MESMPDETDKLKWNEKWIKKNAVEILSWVSDALLSALSIMGQEVKLMFEEYRGNNKIILESENIAREELRDPDEEIKRRIKEYWESDIEIVEGESPYLSDGAKRCRKQLDVKKAEFYDAIHRTKLALKSLKDSLIN